MIFKVVAPYQWPVARRYRRTAVATLTTRMAEPHIDGEIQNGRHAMAVRVYYEDTDFTGIVYHASYLRFMERGRTNYLRLIGADHRSLFEETEREAPGFAFVVRSMTIDFLKPARMDDVLDVVTTPEQVKGASMMLLQQCRRGDELLVEAHVRVAFISAGKAQRIPMALRVAMKADQERSG
jgi:acyl-CoA thioester hydrolase